MFLTLVTLVIVLGTDHAFGRIDISGSHPIQAEEKTDDANLLQTTLENTSTNEDVSWRHYKMPHSVMRGAIEVPQLPAWTSGIANKLGLLAEKTIEDKLNDVQQHLSNVAQQGVQAVNSKAEKWVSSVEREYDSKVLHHSDPAPIRGTSSSVNAATPITSRTPNMAGDDVVKPIANVQSITHAPSPGQEMGIKHGRGLKSRVMGDRAPQSFDGVELRPSTQTKSLDSTPIFSPMTQNPAPVQAGDFPADLQPKSIVDDAAARVLTNSVPSFDLAEAQRKIDEALNTKMQNTMVSVANMATAASMHLFPKSVSPDLNVQDLLIPESQIKEKGITLSDTAHTIDVALGHTIDKIQDATANLANSLVDKATKKLTALPVSGRYAGLSGAIPETPSAAGPAFAPRAQAPWNPNQHPETQSQPAPAPFENQGGPLFQQTQTIGPSMQPQSLVQQIQQLPPQVQQQIAEQIQQQLQMQQAHPQMQMYQQVQPEFGAQMMVQQDQSTTQSQLNPLSFLTSRLQSLSSVVHSAMDNAKLIIQKALTPPPQLRAVDIPSSRTVM